MGWSPLGDGAYDDLSEAFSLMQMTLADPAVDSIELVLAAWSDALPTTCPVAETDEDFADALVAQLSLRLGTAQIPLWDDRKA